MLKSNMKALQLKVIFHRGDFITKVKIHRERRILRHSAAIKYHVVICSAHHVACLALPDFRTASPTPRAASRVRPLGSRASLLRVFGVLSLPA